LDSLHQPFIFSSFLQLSFFGIGPGYFLPTKLQAILLFFQWRFLLQLLSFRTFHGLCLISSGGAFSFLPVVNCAFSPDPPFSKPISIFHFFPRFEPFLAPAF